jgi:hypothetical protein
MAIFKPEIKEFSDSSNKFLGVNNFAILGFQDKSGDFDWADLYIEVEVQQEFSDYSRKLQIKGSFDKDDKGLISGGSVLKRLYTFFEAIGCTAGLTVEGKWEDENGEKIESIREYLGKHFTADNKVKLTKDIKWLKGKGYLKELTDEVVSDSSMSEGGLANL